MTVLGLGWLATRTAEPEAMTSFAAEVLGLQPSVQADGHASFTLANGDVFEVFGPDHDGGGHPGTGPIGAFRVDDARASHQAALRLGGQVGDLREEDGMAWFYLQAPDGHQYEIFQAP